MTDGRTDRRTDILPRHIPRYAYASRDKNNNNNKNLQKYNNNNVQDNVYGTAIMAEPLREFTRFI